MEANHELPPRDSRAPCRRFSRRCGRECHRSTATSRLRLPVVHDRGSRKPRNEHFRSSLRSISRRRRGGELRVPHDDLQGRHRAVPGVRECICSILARPANGYGAHRGLHCRPAAIRWAVDLRRSPGVRALRGAHRVGDGGSVLQLAPERQAHRPSGVPERRLRHQHLSLWWSIVERSALALARRQVLDPQSGRMGQGGVLRPQSRRARTGRLLALPG